MKTKSKSLLWVTDADNTLWDTNAIFERAHLGLLASVEDLLGIACGSPDRLKYIRDVDQMIASMHAKGLRYPVELLIAGVECRLRGGSVTHSVDSVLKGEIATVARYSNAIEKFTETISLTPDLRMGVLEGVAQLAEYGATIVVATEGAKSRIDSCLRIHRLSEFVSACVEGAKTSELYCRISESVDCDSQWVIGDQLDRDVLPAISAGFNAAYFPGGFLPSWHVPSNISSATVVVNDYFEAVKFAMSGAE
ncbi:hypothetical protein ACIP1X_05510 [Pseudomonas sp. NPDC088885]|uniref:hypothetical protein n=1 Tax=Pseudomonas sp. NPDC088885 TaxID=3364457 RepID=UPI0037F288FA